MKNTEIIAVYEQLLAKNPAYRKKIGAFYTPAVIVNYMVEQCFTKAFAHKSYSEACQIRLIDPACGGGAFLVGAYEYLLKYHCQKRNKILSLAERKKILFAQIFGVDIDKEAVEVCKQALLITCYESENVDTSQLNQNIKCGNSLISRFAVDSDLKQALKKSKWTIESYQIAVDTYRNAENKEQKREMERLIENIKSDFRTEISKNDPKLAKLYKLNEELTTLTTQQSIFGMSDKEKKAWNKNVEKKTKEVQKLETEIEDIKSNKIYENAFEWRFEFPEVLNENGNFVGFDVVIGNPPYGVSIKEKTEREYLVSTLTKVPDFEIYYWFINKGHHILKQNGLISYIIPNTILFNVFAQSYRLGLFDNWSLDEILDCTNFNIFEDATVRNIIFQFTKSKSKKNTLGYKSTANSIDFESLITQKKTSISKETAEYNIQNWGLIFKLDDTILDIIKKLKTNNLLGSNYDTTQGYIPYRKFNLIKVYGADKAESIVKNREWHSDKKINTEYKEEIWGKSITKYNYKHTGSFVWYGKHLATYVDLKYFNQKRILIREITNPTIIACLIEEEFVNDPQIINIIQKEDIYSLEYLWAILNSKLATFYHFNSSPKATKGAFPKVLVYDINNFPLPKNNDKNIQEKIETLVVQILTKKSQDNLADTTDLENHIDQLVYQLYDLIEEEIKIIEKA